MNKSYDATVAGHICLDIIPLMPATGLKEINHIFVPGKLIQVNEARISTGGPVSNTGIALSKLGLSIAFMARIGNDHFGKLIQNLLTAQGQVTGVSVSADDRTSYTVVIAPPGIDRIFLHHSGANDHFTSADLDEDIIQQSRLFHFGYPPIMASCYLDEGDELQKIFQFAKTAGAITSLDMALPDPASASGKAPWKKILKKVLPFVDIFMPSIEEIFFMLDPDKYFEIKSAAASHDIINFIEPEHYFRLAEQCLHFGNKIVALKAAHRGYYILTNNLEKNFAFSCIFNGDVVNWSDRELWCPAFRVEEIASATGSGDSSIAGFLSAFLKGNSIEDTLKYANCVGYQNLQELDAISGIKSWEETSAMLIENKFEITHLPLKDHNWKWDEKYQVWIGAGDKNY